jgi:uracil-DNA glycosylase
MDKTKLWKVYLQTKCNDPTELIPIYHKQKYNYNNLKENFYSDMLNTWTKLNYRDKKNVQEILQQQIWNSDLIR